MENSDSENEDFLSADEFVSDEENEQSAKVVKSSKPTRVINVNSNSGSRELPKEPIVVEESRHTDQALDSLQCEAHDPTARWQIQDRGDDNEEDGQVEVRSYRKRPERPKKVSTLVSKPKPDFNPIVDIVKVARPDAIINDLKSHLTSNISKGFATFQETSSSLKGLVMGNFPLDNVKQESAKFVYDDDRTKGYDEDSWDNESKEVGVEAEPECRSAINDEILKLSYAFAKLNEASAIAATAEKAKQVEQLESFLETNVLQEIKQQGLENFPAEDDSGSVDSRMVESTGTAYGGTLGAENIWKEEKNTTVIDAKSFDEVDEQENQRSDNEETKVQKVAEVMGMEVEGVNAPALNVNVINSEAIESSNVVDGWDSWNCESSLETKSGMILSDDAPSASESTECTDIKISAPFDTNHDAVDEVATSSKEKIQPNEEVTSSPANDGWDDWNSENEGDDETPPQKAKNDQSEKMSEYTKEKEEQEEDLGWGDWGDEVEKNDVKIKEETADDGWGDWGDDFTSFPAKTKTETVAVEKRPVGSLALKTSQTLQQKEWTGWDSFGQKKDKDWGIGGWGINTLLSTATAVTSNLSAVIESGLGVPDPQTLARMQKEESQKESSEKVQSKEELQPKEDTSQFPFRHIVTGVGKIVEVAKVQEIGSRVLSGGLDTLETIGRKTMEVLQEGDPGLKKKRALLLGTGQQLSLVLKEARDRAAAEDRRADELAAGRRRHFETVFDDFQGLVHLEALEMLSRQCQLRLEQIQQSLPADKLRELEDTLDEVRQLCEVDEDFDSVEIQDFKEAITEVAHPLRNELSVARIVEVHERIQIWLEEKGTTETVSTQVYDEAISTIAELTAAVTMQFHKSGELLILKERRKTVEEADSLLQLSSHLCSDLKSLTEKLVILLGSRNEPEAEILVNNLRVESENAIAYIKQAFSLLVPVLQLGAT